MSTTAAPPPEGSDSRLAAKELTDRLMNIVRLSRDLRLEEPVAYESVKSDIYTADVEGDVTRFSQQLAWTRYVDLPFPCVRPARGSPIPVSAFRTPVWPLATRPRRYRFWADIMYNVLQDLPSIMTAEVIYIDAEEVTGFLEERLIDFLTARFRARQSDISTSPGLQFTVSTKTNGLRVHYSPAYFFDSTNVLNSPTSPVTGWIQPGRYIFGAGRLGVEPSFDFTAEYDVPPQTHADLEF